MNAISKAARLVAAALDCEPSTITQSSGINRHPKWDSFGHLQVMLMLEKELNVTINDETIIKYTTATEIEQLIKNQESGDGHS